MGKYSSYHITSYAHITRTHITRTHTSYTNAHLLGHPSPFLLPPPMQTLAAAASVFSFVAVKGFKDYQQHSYLLPHPALNDAIVRLAVLSVLALISALTEALSLLLLSLAAWGWRRSDHCIVSDMVGRGGR